MKVAHGTDRHSRHQTSARHSPACKGSASDLKTGTIARCPDDAFPFRIKATLDLGSCGYRINDCGGDLPSRNPVGQKQHDAARARIPGTSKRVGWRLSARSWQALRVACSRSFLVDGRHNLVFVLYPVDFLAVRRLIVLEASLG